MASKISLHDGPGILKLGILIRLNKEVEITFTDTYFDESWEDWSEYVPDMAAVSIITDVSNTNKVQQAIEQLQASTPHLTHCIWGYELHVIEDDTSNKEQTVAQKQQDLLTTRRFLA